MRRIAMTLSVLLASGGPVFGGTTVTYIMTIDGAQETPSGTTSAAFGSGTATLDLDTNLFSWNLDYQDLTGPLTAAHFHGPAPRCVSANVELTISKGGPATGTLMGSATISGREAADFLAGQWYVNLHTAMHPSGEIRAQAMPGELADPLPAVAAGSVHVELQTLADGLTAPNWATHAPGDADRLFVTDQNGILWAIELETGEKNVFLDVSPLLVELGIFGPGSFDERGLLGVAFHPDYQSNGLLYTYTSEPVFKPSDFSTQPRGVLPDHRAVIREWQVPEPGNPDSVVDPTTSRALVRIDEPQFNHNGGAVNFGPDGMLHISLGDGGGADDQDLQGFIGGPIVGHGCIGNGADPSNVLGTVLRIDPMGTNSANGNYGIPPDNPFVGVEGFVEEIFAYGFRNPFRFSFDSLTGDLYLADVGQNHVEEINIVVAGGNYGWNVKEGSFTFATNGLQNGYATILEDADSDGLIDPIAEYDHDDGIAVIGGFVYRGIKIPALAGRYVFGEFAISFNNDGRLFHLGDDNQIEEFQLIDQPALALSLLGMGQDAAGEVYALANATGTPFGTTGVVLRIAPKLGDLDADGVVGINDLLTLLADWGKGGVAADLDMNGIVGINDFLLLLGNWG